MCTQSYRQPSKAKESDAATSRPPCGEPLKSSLELIQRATAEPPTPPRRAQKATTEPPEASRATMTHFLNSRFAFFYLRRDRSQKETDAQGYQNAVQKIGSFDSVEGFFGIYDHFVKPSFINQ